MKSPAHQLHHKHNSGRRVNRSLRRSLSMIALAVAARPFQVNAAPNGMQVVQGAASVSQSGPQMNINVSNRAFLNWNSFNVAPGESVRFQQPSASSIVFNNINGGSPSQIFGSVQANGVLVLANQSGFYFGPNAFVQAAGLCVTTSPIVPSSAIGMMPSLGEPPPGIPIINYGRLETSTGGSLFLISKQIENHGVVSAPEGVVGLVGAKDTLLSDRPDGRGLSVKVSLPDGSIDNQGKIAADAGRVLMQAKTVNQGGIVQANSAREKNGVIEIFAAEKVELQAGSNISAQGGADGPSNGGQISIKSEGVYKDNAGSIIDAQGGANGGHGGSIEISAPNIETLNSQITARAESGWSSGSFLLDPNNITIGNSGTDTAPDGQIGSGDFGTRDLNLDIATAFQTFSSITLQAKGTITVRANWDLPTSTGKDEVNSKLTLQAGKDIALQAGGTIKGGENWSISLQAGVNFANGNTISSGVGNVTLTGAAVVETGKGSIEVKAGNNVTVASGAIRTTDKGNIDVIAVKGNVNAGTNPNGFLFSATGYAPQTELGGISTAGGGNVSITAGRDVIAFVPPSSGPGVAGDAGVGAFGDAAGNVTIKAGRDVSGHYVLRNGEGSIEAGGNVGTASSRFALSLVKGSWDVHAADSITLQEARNPNGVFNQSTVSTGDASPFKFLFDYDPGASVSLSAGDKISLTGTALPRNSQGAGVPIVYPPILNLHAGAGGISIGNDLSLFPSASGNLSLTTTEGGDLTSSSPTVPRRLVISDSDVTQWSSATDFSSEDRGNNLLHLNDPTVANINVSGSVSGFLLTSSKPVKMNVGGDISNSSVKATNLRTDDHTTITAGGAIKYRSFFSFYDLTETDPEPNFDALPWIPEALQGKIVYNTQTRRLAFAGRMQPEERDALLNIQMPEELSGGIITYVPLTFVAPEIINSLFTSSLDVPTSPVPGIAVSGPGHLSVTAAQMNLGVSEGIQSLGVITPAQLKNTPRGASIDINLSGDFDMLSSTIVSRYGGDISLTSGGKIDIGSQDALGTSQLPRGIVTLGGGNIDVTAVGTVDVNGSRIASYDGGDIHVRSETANVNAGTGANGFIIIEKPYVDPETGDLTIAKVTIPGSGILATSFPFDLPGQIPKLGNIKIETPQGDIVAGAGGVVQVDLNGHADDNASIKLVAGTRNADGTVQHVGNIVATGSGVIGSQVELDATGDITGLVISQGNLSINAQQNINVTAIGQGGVNISSGSGSISGTIVGLGAVNVSGANINANVVANVGQANVSGNVTGTGAATQAAPVSTAAQTESKAVEKVAATTSDDEDKDDKKRIKPILRKRVGRVTVILPKS